MSKKFKLKINPEELSVRPLDPKEDLLFIYNSWLKSYKNSDFALSIPNDIYYENHHNMLTRILTQPNNSVTILCDPEDSNTILGYIVYNTKEPIVFYTYIKYSFRGLGLGRYLLEGVRKNFDKDTKIITTHKLRRWKLAKPLGLIYNPYIIKEKENDNNSQD